MDKTEKSLAIDFYITAALSFWFVGFITIYIYSFYFGGITLDQLISFKTDDLPGNLQIGCMTNSFGNHYFGDLTSTLCHSMQDSPYFSPVPTNYFPFAYVVLRPLIQAFKMGAGITAALYFAMFLPIIILAILKKYKNLNSAKKTLILISIFFSQPFLSLIDRGNNQLIVLSMLFIGLYASSKGSGYLGPFCLGIAIALKLYPAIFVIRYIQQRRWLELYIAVKTTALLTLISLLIFDGGVIPNFVEMLKDVNNYRDIRNLTLSYNNSLMALLQSFLQFELDFFGLISFFAENYLYMIVPLVILIVVLLSSMKVTEFENALLGAVFCTLFIELSPAYVFTMFLLPLLFLEEAKTIRPNTYITLISIAFLMAPKTIPLSNPEKFGSVATLSSVLNPIAVVIILVSTIFGIKTRRVLFEI